MYSDELMKYLYKYDLPEKEETVEQKEKEVPVLKVLKTFKGNFATVPVDFKHE